MTLVSIVRTGSVTISFTPTAAARCTITSHSLTRRSITVSLVMVSMAKRKRGVALRAKNVLEPSGREVVDHGHRVAACQQRFGQMAADETGTACNQEMSHRGLSFR